MDKEKINPKDLKPDKEAIVLEMDAVVEVSNKEYLENKKKVVKFEKTKTDDFCLELQIVVDGGIWGYEAACKIAELAAEMREMVVIDFTRQTPEKNDFVE